MGKKDSERERLLRLIDGDAKVAAAVEQGGRFSEQAIKLPKVLSRSGGRALSPRLDAYDPLASGMSLAAKVLWVLLALIMGYGAIDLMAHFLITKTYVPVMVEGTVPNGRNALVPLDPLERYEEAFTKSDVFNPQRISEAPVVAPVEPEGISGALKLVGIDWDEEPVAMIEDVQSGKTYFLKKDTSLKDIKVINIQQDKVTISRGNVVTEIK